VGTSNLRDLPKIRDSLSYVYIEHARVEQRDKALGADLLQPRKPDRFRGLGGEGAIRIDRFRVACMT